MQDSAVSQTQIFHDTSHNACFMFEIPDIFKYAYLLISRIDFVFVFVAGAWGWMVCGVGGQRWSGSVGVRGVMVSMYIMYWLPIGSPLAPDWLPVGWSLWPQFQVLLLLLVVVAVVCGGGRGCGCGVQAFMYYDSFSGNDIDYTWKSRLICVQPSSI